MSMPSFPASGPVISREEAVNQIIASIALEELSLSHILNAGGESLQYVLGTLAGQQGSNASTSEVLAASESVLELLEASAENQHLLKEKLKEVLSSVPSQGIPGPAGPAGVAGPAGATGPAGIGASSATAFAANTRGTILVVTQAGTAIPLPDNHLLSPGITINDGSTAFTVASAGRYSLSYEINTTSALAGGARLLVNGAPNMVSTLAPMLPARRFSNQFLLDLPAGADVSLQMFGVLSTTALMPGGTGASLTIIHFR